MGAKTALFASPRSNTHRSAARGYTLHELLVTLAIVSVAAALGAHGWDMVQRLRQTSEVNEFLALLALARSEAVARRERIVFCPSASGADCDPPSGDYTAWHQGVLLFVDADGDRRREEPEPVVRVHAPAAAGLVIKSAKGRARVVFQPDGTAGGTNLTFTFCDRRGTDYVRYLVVSNTGRARVASEPPDSRTDEPVERCP